ncbi:MAG: phosphate ABC transporter permease subunit PstC, partial [Bacteroidota bacterium]
MSSEKISKGLLFAASLLIVLLTAGMIYALSAGSIPAFKEFGVGFIFSSEWDPTEGRESYGALSFIAGTIFTSVF